MKKLVLMISLLIPIVAYSETLKEPMYNPSEVIGLIKDKYQIDSEIDIIQFYFNYIQQTYSVEFYIKKDGKWLKCIDCSSVFIVPNTIEPKIQNLMHG